MPKEADAIGLLKADHAAVKKLFAQAEKPSRHDGEKKADVFNEISVALQVHATEESFYSAVKKAKAEHLKGEMREAYQEHKQIKTLIGESASITPGDESHDMKIKVLKEDLVHHVQEEKGEMFPNAKKFLGEGRLVELGAELETANSS